MPQDFTMRWSCAAFLQMESHLHQPPKSAAYIDRHAHGSLQQESDFLHTCIDRSMCLGAQAPMPTQLLGLPNRACLSGCNRRSSAGTYQQTSSCHATTSSTSMSTLQLHHFSYQNSTTGTASGSIKFANQQRIERSLLIQHCLGYMAKCTRCYCTSVFDDESIEKVYKLHNVDIHDVMPVKFNVQN